MDINLKYQYTYFIYPYRIDKKSYVDYIANLLGRKNCRLKMYEKERDIDIYNYFNFPTRNYMFQSFEFSKEDRRDVKRMQHNMRAKVLAKMPVTIFEYTFPEDIHGKTENEDLGIFFSIQKMELVLFRSGICFLLLKTNIEESNKFKDLLQFNYKFKLIEEEENGLKTPENIKIQTSAFSNTSELMNLISSITGKTLRDENEVESFTDKFFTYSYACIDSENWNENTDFEELKNEFYKFSHVLPSDYNVYTEVEEEKLNLFKDSKYIKYGFSRSGATVLTSGIDTYNYTKLPEVFEKEYLYTFIISLYQKIYINNMNLGLSTNSKKELEEIKDEFIKFTKTVWFKEITNDETGRKLYQMWLDIFGIEMSYTELKSKYSIIYKNEDLEENKKINTTLAVIITIAIIVNVITFIIYRMM